MNEVWKKLKGYPYEVSNMGNLRSMKKKTWNGKTICTRKAKILKPNRTPSGYKFFNISANGVKKPRYIHRLVAQAFIKNPQNKTTVNHINGIKTDNKVENLEWATRSEQNIHASKLGLKKFHGENHSQHKLNSQQVLEIREKHLLGKPINHLDYGVTKVTILDIIKRRSWIHL